jgi:hypothetical protein
MIYFGQEANDETEKRIEWAVQALSEYTKFHPG